MDISDHAKEVIKKLKEKAKDAYKKFLDKILGRETFYSEDLEEDEEKRNLRERFNELLEKIKDAFENRKFIGTNIVAKFKEIWDQMKEKSIPLGEKARELIKQLKEKANDFWRNILDKLMPSAPEDFEIMYSDDPDTIRSNFNRIVSVMIDDFQHDMPIGFKNFLKFWEYYGDLYDHKVELDSKGKELVAELKKVSNSLWRQILDKLFPDEQKSPEDFEILYGDEDMKTELGKKLKAHFDEILLKFKEIVDAGKSVKQDLIEKMEQIKQKLKDIKMDISDHAKQVIKDMKKNAKDFLKKILNKLHKDKED